MQQRTLQRFVQRARNQPSSVPMRIRMRAPQATRGRLAVGNVDVACVLGRSGVRVRKREGDGATPAGRWCLQSVLYRADRRCRPITALPVKAIRPADGWCDESNDRNYNRGVRRPYPASTEALWREDALYDIVVVLDHNSRPRRRNAGSAIFMHLARPARTPTEGCIALSARDLRLVLARVHRGAAIDVGIAPRPKRKWPGA